MTDETQAAEAEPQTSDAETMANMEGDLDTVHLDWVHRKLSEDAPYAGVGNPGFWNPDPRPPRLDVR